MKRSTKQGPIAINFDVLGTRASGNLNMEGKNRPIDVEIGGPLFADGPGAQYSVAALPLAEGYATSYRNFDIQTAKPRIMQLKVAGVEKVKVPAGEFEAFRIEITSPEGPDKSTVWVAKDSRQPVKISAVLASMGGATLTAELL
jgi:hypothetical protein